MAHETVRKAAEGGFKTSRSAAELAYSNAEGYADPGLAEHKGPKHVEAYWHRGSGGLRPEGHDYSEEEQRLHELEAKRSGSLVTRAMGAVGGAIASAAGAVVPGRFKTSRSAAELAYGEAEGYADPGTSEHKSPKHLENYWFQGGGGLRPEGHDYSEEEQRLHELERKSGQVPAGAPAEGAAAAGGLLDRAKEAAGDYLESAKQMLGMESEKKK